MYKQKPIFVQKKGVNDKTYFRSLVGRVNRLRKMIQKRETTSIGEVQSKIDEVDEQIHKLQLKRMKLESKKDSFLEEIQQIRSEIDEYTEFIGSSMNEKNQPIFTVYIQKKKNPNGYGYYEYYVGRVRSRMRKGILMKDKTFYFGRYEKCVQKIRSELGVELPHRITPLVKENLPTLLEKLLIQWWLESLKK